MADQEFSVEPLMLVTDADIARMRTFTDDLPDALIDSLADQLFLRVPNSRNFVRLQIKLQANAYIGLKSIGSMPSAEEEGRPKLKKVEKSLGKTLAALSALSKETFGKLGRMVSDDNSVDPLAEFSKARETLERLQQAANMLANEHRPKAGRPKYRNLEMAVGSLMHALELATGQRATASLTKGGDHIPRPTSAEADVIIKLLTTVDPSLKPSTIIRKINKIGSQYSGRDLIGFAALVWYPVGVAVPRELRGPQHH